LNTLYNYLADYLTPTTADTPRAVTAPAHLAYLETRRNAGYVRHLGVGEPRSLYAREIIKNLF